MHYNPVATAPIPFSLIKLDHTPNDLNIFRGSNVLPARSLASFSNFSVHPRASVRHFIIPLLLFRYPFL